jgi:hypothetical protein
MERKFRIQSGSPVIGRICTRCGKPIQEGAECYLDPEAPATPEDAAKARVGAAYTAVAHPAHWECHPTGGRNIEGIDT